MAGSLKWNGKEFQEKLKAATSEGLVRAGVFYHTKCRLAVSKPNTGVRKRYKDQSKEAKAKRKASGSNSTSYTVYPNPSKPGESPRLRTGFGRNNVVINNDPKGEYVRVGVTANGIYMFYLEVGTRNIARRPWLLKTLVENRDTIGKLAAIGGKRRIP